MFRDLRKRSRAVRVLGQSLRRTHRMTWWLLLIVVGVSCSAPAPAGQEGGQVEPAVGAPRVVKRITVGTLAEPETRPSSTGPARVILPLVHSGLTMVDDGETPRPLLAEEVPSLENGLWRLFPDGRMETTWRIRAGARWHDGAPFTADDLAFSLQVGRDRELASFNSPAFVAIDEVFARDLQTLVITWKEPYIAADTLFGIRPSLPRHLLEQTYQEGKNTLFDLPYWTHGFVGTGPYRVREWTTNVGVRLQASDDYVLGRPNVDEIELRYIPDANTLSANLLAGAVDVTTDIGIDLGLQLREQWREGSIVFGSGAGTATMIFPQLLDPQPAVVADVRFRRALVHAIDRQEIVDTLVVGMSPVPQSILPNQSHYRPLEANVPQYEYDPRRAAELLQELAYARGPGGLLRDAAGEQVVVEVRTAGPLTRAGAAVADFWQRLGVEATVVTVPPQRAQDFEYVATFPGFLIRGRNPENFRGYHSSQTPLPSNNFRVSAAGNVSRYMNPALDALIETYYRTVPRAERLDLLGQIARHAGEQVTVIPLWHNASPGAISNRLLNVGTRWPAATITWNAHEWDVRG